MKSLLRSYIVGFVLSLVLTLTAAWLVWTHVRSGHVFPPHGFLHIALLVLVIAQLCVQLIFFMHLGARGSAARWRLGAFVSTVGIILIIIVGAIWIMDHLNYNMMASPDEMNAYIQSQDGF